MTTLALQLRRSHGGRWDPQPRLKVYLPPRQSAEETLREEASQSKRYELKREINSSEIRKSMSENTHFYHSSEFNKISHPLGIRARMERMEIQYKGFYELKYSNKNIDILIYKYWLATTEPSELIRINNQKKKICGTNVRLVRRIFQDYIQ